MNIVFFNVYLCFSCKYSTEEHKELKTCSQASIEAACLGYLGLSSKVCQSHPGDPAALVSICEGSRYASTVFSESFNIKTLMSNIP